MDGNLPEMRPAERDLSVRRPRLKKPDYPLTIVVWNDAQSTGTAETTVEELNHNPSQYYSVGWLLRDDERGISIAAEWSPTERVWRGVTFIPKGMVVEVRGLSSR